MLTIQTCPSCQVCALCDQPGAEKLISRAVAGEPTIHPEFTTPVAGVVSEVATVHAHHFPPAFATFTPRVKRQVIAQLWASVDEHRGHRPALERRPVIRKAEGGVRRAEGGLVEFLLAPRASRLATRLHPFVCALARWCRGGASWALRSRRRAGAVMSVPPREESPMQQY